MLGATLQGAAASSGRVKVVTRITVIDRQDISASQLVREIFDPFQGHEVHFSFVRWVRMSRNGFDMPTEIRIYDWHGDETKPIAGFDHAPLLPIRCSRGPAGRV